MDNVTCEVIPGSVQTFDIEAAGEAMQLDFEGDEMLPRVRNARAAVRRYEVRVKPLNRRCSAFPFATLADGISAGEIPF